MIYEPSLFSVLEDAESVKYIISQEYKAIRQRFSAKKLHPDIGRLNDASQKIRHIIKKQEHARLVFTGFPSSDRTHDRISAADKVAHFSRFYKFVDLRIIYTQDQYETMLSFTNWLHQQYLRLRQIGAPLADAVIRGIDVSCYGLRDQTHGVVVLHYRDAYSRKQTKLYRYARQFRPRAGKDGYTLSLTDEVSITPALACAPGDTGRPPFADRAGALICIRSRTPAALEETIRPAATNLLLEKLLELSASSGYKNKLTT